MNCTEIDWKLIFDIIKSISIITASCVAIYGINSWRREARWKRKYELAEEVLSSMYEAHQAIKIIRSPIGFGSEGSSREKSENETKEQTEIYNQAYVTRERFLRNKKSLEKLRSLKYRFITLYGKDYEKYFDKFSQTINRIFSASDLIAMVKLGQFDHDKEFKLQIMKENSKILYNVFKGEDEIEEELKTAITAIEEKCRAIIGKK